jgi:Integrase zinc binding domain
MVGEHGRFLVGEDGLLYDIFTKTDIWVVVPKILRSAVLKLVHGSKIVGHLGVLGTAARLRRRFWWAGWYAAVEKQVANCLACRLSKMNLSRRQARMQVWHTKARFETIAVDVLEISATAATGMKVVGIGDVISRFMMATSVPAETAAAMAEVLFERWIIVFGPPGRLVSDRGNVFVSEVLCAAKDETSVDIICRRFSCIFMREKVEYDKYD